MLDSDTTHRPLRLPSSGQAYHGDDNQKLPVEPIDGISNNAKQQEAAPVSRQRDVAQEHQRAYNQSSASGYPDVHYPSGSSKGELSGLDILTQAATQSMYELHDYSNVYNNGSVILAPYGPEIGTGKRVPYKSQNAVAKHW